MDVEKSSRAESTTPFTKEFLECLEIFLHILNFELRFLGASRKMYIRGIFASRLRSNVCAFVEMSRRERTVVF